MVVRTRKSAAKKGQPHAIQHDMGNSFFARCDLFNLNKYQIRMLRKWKFTNVSDHAQKKSYTVKIYSIGNE